MLSLYSFFVLERANMKENWGACSFSKQISWIIYIFCILMKWSRLFVRGEVRGHYIFCQPFVNRQFEPHRVPAALVRAGLQSDSLFQWIEFSPCFNAWRRRLDNTGATTGLNCSLCQAGTFWTGSGQGRLIGCVLLHHNMIWLRSYSNHKVFSWNNWELV